MRVENDRLWQSAVKEPGERGVEKTLARQVEEQHRRVLGNALHGYRFGMGDTVDEERQESDEAGDRSGHASSNNMRLLRIAPRILMKAPNVPSPIGAGRK